MVCQVTCLCDTPYKILLPTLKPSSYNYDFILWVLKLPDFISDDRTYHFEAPSETAMSKWTTVIRNNIDQSIKSEVIFWFVSNNYK